MQTWGGHSPSTQRGEGSVDSGERSLSLPIPTPTLHDTPGRLQ